MCLMHLASLKSEIHKLDIVKLETYPVDLSQLSDLVKIEVVKKSVCDELAEKFNPIQTTDTNNLVRKADYDSEISEIKKKILDHDHNSKYVITQEFNRLIENFTAILTERFTAILKQANWGTKADIYDLVEKTDFNDELKTLQKVKLKQLQNI